MIDRTFSQFKFIGLYIYRYSDTALILAHAQTTLYKQTDRPDPRHIIDQLLEIYSHIGEPAVGRVRAKRALRHATLHTYRASRLRSFAVVEGAGAQRKTTEYTPNPPEMLKCSAGAGPARTTRTSG